LDAMTPPQTAQAVGGGGVVNGPEDGLPEWTAQQMNIMPISA